MVFVQRAFVSLFFLSLFSAGYTQITGPVPMAWRWVDRIERMPSGSPIVDGDYVYVAVGARLQCLDKATGNLVWRFPPGEPLAAQFVTSSVIIGDVMIAAADDKVVYGISKKTGEVIWHYQSLSPVFSNPVIAGRYVILPLANDTLVALEGDTGHEAWTEPYSNGSIIYPSVAAWDDYVLFLSGDNTLTALNVKTKKPAWRPRGFTVLDPLSEIAVYGNTIYVTSGSYITAVAAGTGLIRWEQRVVGDIRFNATGGPDGVVVVTFDGKMFSFTPAGRPSTRNGFDLGSQPVAAPSFVGRLVAISTSNGSLNLINPFSGETIWNYTVPPMVVGMRFLNANTGASAQDPSVGSKEIKYVTAVGPPVVSGDSIFLLVQDGSIISFDKNLGVDLTPPDAKLIWPNSGDQVSGRAPMELIMQLNDDGSGINFNSVVVTINGKNYIHEIDKEQYIHIRVINGSKENPPLVDGRAKISITVSDWMGNSKTANFVLSIDNLLTALGSPPTTSPTNQPGAGKGGIGGGGGGGIGGGTP